MELTQNAVSAIKLPPNQTVTEFHPIVHLTSVEQLSMKSHDYHHMLLPFQMVGTPSRATFTQAIGMSNVAALSVPPTSKSLLVH